MRFGAIAGEYGIDLRAVSRKSPFKLQHIDAGVLQYLIDLCLLREAGSADQRVVGCQVLPLPLRCECGPGGGDRNAAKYEPFLKNHGKLVILADERMNAWCQLASKGAVVVEVFHHCEIRIFSTQYGCTRILQNQPLLLYGNDNGGCRQGAPG